MIEELARDAATAAGWVVVGFGAFGLAVLFSSVFLGAWWRNRR